MHRHTSADRRRSHLASRLRCPVRAREPGNQLGDLLWTIGDTTIVAIDDAGTSKDLYFPNGVKFWNFATAGRVVDALRQAGIADLSITPT